MSYFLFCYICLSCYHACLLAILHVIYQNKIQTFRVKDWKCLHVTFEIWMIMYNQRWAYTIGLNFNLFSYSKVSSVMCHPPLHSTLWTEPRLGRRNLEIFSNCSNEQEISSILPLMGINRWCSCWTTPVGHGYHHWINASFNIIEFLSCYIAIP